MEVLLGKGLKELSEERGLTQKELSAMLNLNSVLALRKIAKRATSLFTG